MHLTSEELLDLAEGTRPPGSAPHLATCDECRHQLHELRSVMATIAVDVPEPSPLFWDHLSARVREAVAQDTVASRSWFGFGRWAWGVAAVMTAAVVAIAVSLAPRTAPPSITHAPAAVQEPVADAGSVAPADDPSFMLLGDLAGGLDWDVAAEAGIGMPVGAADSAVVELSEAERTELQRLLREAMGSTGA